MARRRCVSVVISARFPVRGSRGILHSSCLCRHDAVGGRALAVFSLCLCRFSRCARCRTNGAAVVRWDVAGVCAHHGQGPRSHEEEHPKVPSDGCTAYSVGDSDDGVPAPLRAAVAPVL